MIHRAISTDLSELWRLEEKVPTLCSSSFSEADSSSERRTIGSSATSTDYVLMGIGSWASDRLSSLPALIRFRDYAADPAGILRMTPPNDAETRSAPRPPRV